MKKLIILICLIAPVMGWAHDIPNESWTYRHNHDFDAAYIAKSEAEEPEKGKSCEPQESLIKYLKERVCESKDCLGDGEELVKEEIDNFKGKKDWWTYGNSGMWSRNQEGLWCYEKAEKPEKEKRCRWHVIPSVQERFIPDPPENLNGTIINPEPEPFAVTQLGNGKFIFWYKRKVCE